MDWDQYLEIGIASTSIFLCFCTFIVYFKIKGFRLRISNLFIVFQQISNLLLSIGILLQALNRKDTQNSNIEDNQVFITGILIESGIISSIVWLFLLSFYYFLRYYLKFIHIGRYIMCLLVVSIVFPVSLSILDIEIFNIDSEFREKDWIRFNIKNFVEPGLIFVTFLFQLIVNLFLYIKYKNGGISTFKLKFAFFDLILLLICFGALEIFSVFEYFNLKIEGLHRVAEVLLASTGTARFLLSECIPKIIEFKEAKDFGALTEHLNKIKY